MLTPLVCCLFLGAQRRDMWYLLVPPICLVPAFAVPFGYRFTRLLFIPEKHFQQAACIITTYSETTELCFYIGVVALAILQVHRSGGVACRALSDMELAVPCRRLVTATAASTIAKSMTGMM